MENTEKEVQVTETQEEQETVLDQIMSNVTLLDPLEIPMSSGQILEITAKEFISYYLPKNASDQEKANCFNEVRVAGLNPAIRGECHFFKTADQPLHLFVGYPVYLRKAKEAGLEHYSIEFDNDESPVICTVTLTIKEREEFVWRTWFDEVASTNFKGELNARWKKAPRQMFIKCAVVNTIRMSMLFDLTMPYIVDEMSDPVAPGHRTLTQPDLDAYEPQESEQEATVGEVSATHHQIDLSPFRKKYFKSLKAQGILQDDVTRRAWQKEIVGVESVSDWDIERYAEAFTLIATGEARTWEEGYGSEDDCNPETEPVDGMSPEAQDKEAEAQAAFAKEQTEGDPDWDRVKEEAEEQQRTEQTIAEAEANGEIQEDFYPIPNSEELAFLFNQYDEVSTDVFETPAMLTDWEGIVSDVPISKWGMVEYRAAIAGLKALKDARVEVKDVTDREALMNIYQEIIKGIWECAQDMTQFQRKVGGHNSFQDFNTNELRTAYIVARSLKAVQIASAEPPTEVGDDFQVEDSEPEKEATQKPPPVADPDEDKPFLITDATVKEIGEALLKFPDLKYKTIKSKAFRVFAFEAIDHEYVAFRKILDDDGKLILDALNEELEGSKADPFGFDADLNDPAVKTTENQMEEMKALIKVMPEPYHQSMGSTAFQALVRKAIGRPHTGGFSTVSAGDAAKVIESMKRIIQEEEGR